MNKKINDYDFEKRIPLSKNDSGVRKTPGNMKLMKELLDSKGPGFCLAKWTQVSVHLGTGLTHSCHHPPSHKIPLSEIENNPSALHNTSFKKEQRKLMLNGERPDECDFCWRIEDNDVGSFSDRIEKSLAKYSSIDHDKIVEMSGEENVTPRYLEVSFSNVCNFKCSYCGPSFSSKWQEEIDTYGAYAMPDGRDYNWQPDRNIPNKENNPYVDAFWEWFPEIMPELDTLRITGGEPLLNKNTFKLIDYLIANPNPDMELSINTNGNPPKKIWEQFIKKINILTNNNCVHKFILYTSCESYGDHAEYIRHGLNYNEFESNVIEFLDSTVNTTVVFMSSFNLLAIPKFQNFLEFVLYLKRRFNRHNGFFDWIESKGISTKNIIDSQINNRYDSTANKPYHSRKQNEINYMRINIDIPYVRHPDFLDARLADKKLIEDYLLPAFGYMGSNSSISNYDASLSFENWEVDKFRRIIEDIVIHHEVINSNEYVMKQHQNSMKRFLAFVNEHDRRRNTSFLDTFPEMAHYFNDSAKH